MPLRKNTLEEDKKRYIDLLEHESLFRELDPAIEKLDDDDRLFCLGRIEEWDEAKLFVRDLLAEKFPDKILKYQVQILQKKCQYLDCFDEETGSRNIGPLKSGVIYYEMNAILVYAKVILDVMYRFSNEDLYNTLSKLLEDEFADEDNNEFVYRGMYLQIVVNSGINDGRIITDYDYVINQSISMKADVTEGDTRDEGECDAEPIDFKSRQVPLEIMKQLLECAGAKFDENGTQKPAAQLISDLTGIPYHTCKNYLSYGKVNLKMYKEEVDKAKAVIDEIGLSVDL